MTRILFVDDEPRVLDGLRRMLHGKRSEWDMAFSDSGSAALELMATAPFDILVTDMRMPQMSGNQLLAKVKDLHPDVVRVVLSGHAETSTVMQAFGVAQQYLVKPCEQGTLVSTVNQALALRKALNSPDLKARIGSLTSLPTLPAVYRQLVSCLQSPDASLIDVGRIIAEDVGMTTSILKVVNSAYFGLNRPITTVERAVTFLGLETIMALVLEHGLFGQGEATKVVNIGQLRHVSLMTAGIARKIATYEKAGDRIQDEAFLAGMLHDMGTLVLASQFPECYSKVVALVESSGVAWQVAERQALQATHAEAGAYLLGLWGFQDSLVEAVLYHDSPDEAPDTGWGLTGIVHVACCMARHSGVEDPDDPALGLDTDYLTQAGLQDHWPAWREACRDILQGDHVS